MATRSTIARLRSARTLGAMSSLLVAGTVLAACGSSGTAATPAAGSSSTAAGSIKGQTITLYNGQHEQTTDALVKAFEKQTGVTVKVRNDDEDVLAQQIEQEGANSPADVFFTENTPPLARLDEKGLLAPGRRHDVRRRAGSQYSAGDHNWVGVSARVSVMVYNTERPQAGRSAEVGARPRQPEVEGQAGHRARPRPTSSRSSPRSRRTSVTRRP